MADFAPPSRGLLLTATAGWVDAVGFVRLQGFYPSFMSIATLQKARAGAQGSADGAAAVEQPAEAVANPA